MSEINLTETLTKNGFRRLKNMKKEEYLKQEIKEGERYCGRCHRVWDEDFFRLKKTKSKFSKLCQRCRDQINTCTKKYDDCHKDKTMCEVCKLEFIDIEKHKRSKYHKHIEKLISNLS